MNNLKIYCIVATYNGIPWLPNHIASIKQSLLPLDVVYVDNASIDGTPEYIHNQFPEAFLIESNENLGFGKANNLGVQFAIEKGADYVLLLNQDVYLEKSTVSNCLSAFLNQSDNIALVSPIHLNGAGTSLDSGFQKCISEDLCPGYISDLVLGKLKANYLVHSVNAAAWMIKVEVIKKIGLFSNAFFHYGEDINFQQRLKYFGYKALLISDAFIFHDREERKGEKTELGKINEIKTNQMTILMDVNLSYNSASSSVIKYAGKLFFERKFIESFILIWDTFWNRNKYKIWRAQMKNGSIL